MTVGVNPVATQLSLKGLGFFDFSPRLPVENQPKPHVRPSPEEAGGKSDKKGAAGPATPSF
jgi:hypothetical protein